MSGAIDLQWPDLAVAAALILLNGGLSLWLRLGMERQLLVASARTLIQLTLLGYVLVPVLTWRNPWAVAALCLLMLLAGAREAVSRSKRRFRGMATVAFLSLLVGALATTLLATTALLQTDPWWEPRYLIPLLGMVLGNGLTGVALGLDRGLAQLDEGRHRVEALLALGATRWEAARPVVAEAVRTGMVPIVNSMSVVGLVFIPGMMTGQLLAGADPVQAARYQVLIMFLIAGTVALGTGIAVVWSVLAMFDDHHRLRLDRLGR